MTAYTGVFGSSPADPISALGTGVWGDSDDVGVFGFGGAGVYGVGSYGVIGESISTSAGVLAVGQSATDVALEVQGKVKFSRSGRATLGAGKSSIKVTLAGTTTGSRVFAVLHSNRTGRWVQSVVPTTGLVHDLPERHGHVLDVHRLVRDQLRWPTTASLDADHCHPGH